MLRTVLAGIVAVTVQLSMRFDVTLLPMQVTSWGPAQNQVVISAVVPVLAATLMLTPAPPVIGTRAAALFVTDV